MTTPPRLIPLVFALAAVIGCGATSSGMQSQEIRRSPDRITAEEMASAGVATVYDAILRLRPDWFTRAAMRNAGGHTDAIQVYYESTHYGTVESLRQLAVGGVQDVKLLNATDATTRFGVGNSGGAILITIKQP